MFRSDPSAVAGLAHGPDEAYVLGRLTAWGRAESGVRAMLLTSGRARPAGEVDAFSDYDVILAVADVEAFTRDEAWLSGYGQPMVRWGDQSVLHGLATYFRGVVYKDYVKIDYSIWPASLLETIAARPVLPDELDAGYRVLLDKDGRTAAWPAATNRAYIPARPTPAEYEALVEEFWWTTTYVAKSLVRDELLFAKFCLDHDIKSDVLRRLLEWRVELDHAWSLRPGVLGRGLKRLVPTDIWSELANTYVGPDSAANWAALFRSIDLFRRLAIEIGDALGYSYPQPIDDWAMAHLTAMHELARNDQPRMPG